MKNAVETWHPEPNGANGNYATVDIIEEERIWATRTTPIHKYVDDVLFEFSSDSGDF